MKKILLLLILIITTKLTFGQTKQICITLDDLPVVTYGFSQIKFQQDVTNKLIQIFDQFEIPAIGFVNESKLYRGGKLQEERVEILRSWLNSGYELGNHTYAHKDYHKVSFDEFAKDILKGEVVCKELVKSYDQSYTYFRHPYLHVGLNKTNHDTLRSFLENHQYIEAPVSVDNDDYIFAYAYSKALVKGDRDLMHRIGEDYVDYMENKLLYFQEQSQKLFGRNIRHILLLHANAINSDYLDDIATRYRDNGYTFVSMSEALEDVAYQRELMEYKDWGISWIDRWAIDQGKKGDFFKLDPKTPEYVKSFLK